MKIVSIKKIDYKGKIYTPQVKDNENYFMGESCILSKNCQNLSEKSLKLVLSRIDKTCKVIIIGSNAQIDNIYVNKYNNGLSKVLKTAYFKHDEVNLFACKLNKVYRGPITEWAERIFK